MTSRRSRSPERSRDHSRHHRRRRHSSYSRSRSRSRSRSPTVRLLPYDASSISEEDYFQKIDEFRVWLKDEKDKYFDELKGDKQRHYFRKFIKAWNRGKLEKSLYAGVASGHVPTPANTGYKWKFSKNTEISKSRGTTHTSSSSSSSIIKGPSMPTSSDLTLARELQSENVIADAKLQRKRDRREAQDRIEDMVGPKAVGKEAILEKKRMKQEGNRAFREGREDAGLEMDDNTLMGGGDDSFKAQIARRDAARQRYQELRGVKDVEKQERQSQYREKEKATMDMFKQLAQQRFG